MLGTSAGRIDFRTFADFGCAADYLSYMFGGVQGVAYRATIDPTYHHSYYRAGGLISADFDGVDNCYVSMNTFYRTAGLKRQAGRSVDLLKRLNAFYVDIDCYKVGLSKNEVLLRLEDEFFGSQIPEPTFIIDSGRGIYLVWKLRNEDKKALPRWTAVQNYLVDTLAELGADQACKDAARILRVPGSRNAKSGTTVSILEFCDLTYSIYDIAREYGIKGKSKKRSSCRGKQPYGHATEKQRKYVLDIAEKKDIQSADLPNFENFQETAAWIGKHKAQSGPQKGYCWDKGNIYDLSEYKAVRGVMGSYCAEIRQLLTMRKGADCKREIALFLYRYFLREMKYDSSQALKETLSFNADLDCPFDEAYVEKVTASADRRVEKGIPYAYKKSTIIKLLEITKEELEKLPFFAAGVKERAERKKEANRRAYESRLAAEGKVAKKDAVVERRAAILVMLQQGKDAAEIQQTLNIGKSTYYRDLACLDDPIVKAKAEAMLKHGEQKKTDERATEGAKKRIFSGAVRAVRIFQKNVFPKIQPSIYREYSVAVPHSSGCPVSLDKSRRWLVLVHSGSRDSGEPSGDPAHKIK